ncbi:pseudouridine synthase [Phycomyces blakesleeanus]
MGGIWSKETNDTKQEVAATEGVATVETLGCLEEKPGEKRKNTGKDDRPKGKRVKTASQRKEHFEKKGSWKAKEKEAWGVKREVDPNQPKEPRYPKKKVALLIGFCGTGYQGMQMNKDAKTIEGALFDAMVKVGAISKANSEDASKINWMRTARTDKGVHAACNVVSCKMAFPVEDMTPLINAELPEQIRVWNYVQTARSFHAKVACDSRIYEYLLPSYAFAPPKKYILTTEPTSDTDVMVSGDNGQTKRYVARSTAEELATLDSYRIDQDTLERFREALSMFVGTHNFHNYTIGRSPTDNSSNRYIMSIKVDDPIYINGCEWLSVKLQGQSFMLHQIRKMVSMAILTVRSKTPLKIIKNSFDNVRINIPKAPAVGLLLERPVFDSFNKSLQMKDATFNAVREPVEFHPYKDEIEAFKQKWIYSTIFAAEAVERGFDTFLRTVDAHFGHEFNYLNSDGEIPDECIVYTKFSGQTKKKDDSEDEIGAEE